MVDCRMTSLHSQECVAAQLFRLVVAAAEAVLCFKTFKLANNYNIIS